MDFELKKLLHDEDGYIRIDLSKKLEILVLKYSIINDSQSMTHK